MSRKDDGGPVKANYFYLTDPIMILSFLPDFQVYCNCNVNGSSQGVVVWLLLSFNTQAHIHWPQKQDPSTKETAEEEVQKAKDSTMTSYSLVVNYLLRTYATNENISKAESVIKFFKQGDSMTLVEYGNTLSGKKLRCDTVYQKRCIKSLFVEGLNDRTKPAVQTSCSENCNANFHRLTAFPASSATLGGAASYSF